MWGGITGHPLTGLLVALAIEASNWTKVRWDFGDAAFSRALRASYILFLLIGGLVWMNSSVYSAMSGTFMWLPIALFPLQFVQSYGLRNDMSLVHFSYHLRQRQAHARINNLPYRDVRFNFGNVYFTLVLVSASVGDFAHSIVYFPAAAVLIAWIFRRAFMGKKGRAPVGATLMILLATLGAYGGERALDMLYRRAVGGSGSYHGLGHINHIRTSIGDLGEIKNTSAIQWRLIQEKGGFPELLRIASYNNYLHGRWRTDASKLANQEIGDTPGEFEELPSYGTEDEEHRITARGGSEPFVEADAAVNPEYPHFMLRGSFARKSLLPIPGNTANLIQASQLLEINPYGSLIHDPQHPVANARIFWHPSLTTALPPWEDPRVKSRTAPDLRLPREEVAAVRKVVEELGLRDVPLREKIRRLESYFSSQFTYTRYLKDPGLDNPERQTFISTFLNHTRTGHCEYFATATTLILREAGVPSRYATGYLVAESDPDRKIAYIRGTHAHAWSMAWDEDRGIWVDVDTTPGGWIGEDAGRISSLQKLLDWINMRRDDIQIWRTEPGNMAIAIAAIVLPLTAGALLVARRLWRSRRRIAISERQDRLRRESLATALNHLEDAVALHLGPRPPGEPLGRWLEKLSPILPNREILREAIELHQSLRYDPRTDEATTSELLEKRAAELESQLDVIALPDSQGAMG